jgi:EAL domain-containing protein (putative c-di-GMP-specific phosphodiesterase class I)
MPSYTSTERLRLSAGRAWLPRLRHALAEDLFVLHFQPIVALPDRAVTHHEALLRLADEPQGRLVLPAFFLPVAERSGLIRDIDRMVLAKVIALLGSHGREHGDRAHVGLAVNISALSITDATLLAHLQRQLERHSVDPGLLILELTETAAITDLPAARSFCASALALGCGVALDDFGSGYGSFHYLKHLPFSHLKIDGEFIRRLPHSRTDQLIVQALADVVRGMGRKTVAEFVGDEHTVEILQRFGVDYAQGFQIGRPHPIRALAC